MLFIILRSIGVGSYMLQLMVVSFLQLRYREDANAGRPFVPNLGSLLMEFLDKYGGGGFNYITTGISVVDDGALFPKGEDGRKEFFWDSKRQFSLALSNPEEENTDVGKPSFKIGLVARAFSCSYKALLARVAMPFDASEGQSILESIIPLDRSAWKEMRRKAKGTGE